MKGDSNQQQIGFITVEFIAPSIRREKYVLHRWLLHPEPPYWLAMARAQSQQLPQRPPAVETRAQTSDGARERSPSPNTEWQGRILEELALNSRRGGGLPVPHYKREFEPFSSHTFDASSTDCSDGKAPQEDSMAALESKKSNAREPPSSFGTWLPDVSEVISRLRAGAEGFSSTEMERIQSAFQRFKDPDNPEIHKDELPKVLMHLGYTQISEDHVKELADSITKFPNLEKGEFIYFMEKHVEYEFEAFKEIFERFDEDGNGTLDADELCVFLSSLGFTPLRSIIRESLDLVDLDGNGVLDFEETVILMHVYRHSEGFTIDELQELTSVFMEQQQQAVAQPNGKTTDERLLPADRLYHLLLQFFGPRAADFSQDLQQELSSAGRRRSAMAAQGAAGQVPTGPAALTFQEAVLWARRFREKMFTNYREVFKKYDDDNSNSIDMSEVRNVIKDLGFTIPQKTVDELVYEARVRGDIVHRTEDTNLDYDSFVHFMQILNENDGFNGEEITRIQKTFHKFDLDGSGDISSIELADMLRELGQCSKMEEVRSLLSAVDINGNGVLDMREFIRFMRLFREKQLARVKMVFTKQADPHVDPPMLPAAQVEEAVYAVLSEEAVEIALADGQSIAKDKSLEFEEFVRITDELREYCVWTSKKFAGYSQMEVEGLRHVFDGFDVKKTGLLRQTEATELLKTLGIEVRSVEERLLLSDQIARACDAAREAGAQGVVDQHVNFWVFLQLFRSMRRKQDEENERRLMTVSEEAKFNSQEVSQFQEVFDHAFISFVGGHVTSSDQKLIPRTGIYKLLRSMGLRVEGRDRQALDEEISNLNKDGLDFPNFLLLMRWMVDVDFGQISSGSL
eukprot:s518_g15.t1